MLKKWEEQWTCFFNSDFFAHNIYTKIIYQNNQHKSRHQAIFRKKKDEMEWVEIKWTKLDNDHQEIGQGMSRLLIRFQPPGCYGNVRVLKHHLYHFDDADDANSNPEPQHSSKLRREWLKWKHKILLHLLSLQSSNEKIDDFHVEAQVPDEGFIPHIYWLQIGDVGFSEALLHRLVKRQQILLWNEKTL